MRCDWRSDPEAGGARDQLVEHAVGSGHPVCAACRRSLRSEERQVCEPCLTESRSLLAGISLMTAELPGHLGQLRGSGFDQTSRSREKPLPGGDALVLAGPGSGGTGARVLTRRELGRGLVQGIDGREHHLDNRDTDAVSVAQVLTEWEDAWRHTRGESAAFATSINSSVRGAVGYLEVHARWAADEYDDFPDYLAQLRQLHTRLERATGRDDRPVKAEANCFECSGTLLRLRKDGKPCTHTTPPGWPAQYGIDDLGRVRLMVPAAKVRERHEERLEVWEDEHRVCEQGGFADKWACSRCGVEYEYGRYLRAVADRLRVTATGWTLPAHVAQVLDVPLETVRTWAKRGHVASACLVGDPRLRVSYEEVVVRVHRLEAARVRAAARAAEKASEARAS